MLFIKKKKDSCVGPGAGAGSEAKTLFRLQRSFRSLRLRLHFTYSETKSRHVGEILAVNKLKYKRTNYWDGTEGQDIFTFRFFSSKEPTWSLNSWVSRYRVPNRRLLGDKEEVFSIQSQANILDSWLDLGRTAHPHYFSHSIPLTLVRGAPLSQIHCTFWYKNLFKKTQKKKM